MANVVPVGFNADGQPLAVPNGQDLEDAGGTALTGGGGAAFSGWDATTAPGSLTASTTHVIGFSSETTDTDGFHDNVTNNNRFTVPGGLAGRYFVSGYMEWGPAANTSNALLQVVHYNSGGTPLGTYQRASSEMPFTALLPPQVDAGFILDMSVGDYVRIQVFFVAGANVGVNNVTIRGQKVS
jgi:hypothetical protein